MHDKKKALRAEVLLANICWFAAIRRLQATDSKAYTIEPADLTVINPQPVGDYFINDVWNLTGGNSKEVIAGDGV